jgi:hypothetical protein
VNAPVHSARSTRRLFLLAGASMATLPRISGAPIEFWNKKPPSEWTRDEIDRLITKSPWAKEANAQSAAGEANSGGNPGQDPNGAPNGDPNGNPGGGTSNGGGQNRPRIGIGGLGIPGLGGLGLPGGGQRRGNGTPRGGAASGYQGTVRWESARPIFDALKAPLPDSFDGHYVICVNGIPLLSSRSTYSSESDDSDTVRRQEHDDLERLKGLSSLQLKGKPVVQAGVVARQVASGQSFLIGFSKEMLSLDFRDGEVLFTTQMGRLVVKARFLPKEMLYHDGLAV